MSRYQSSFEEFCFSSTDELVQFLKEEWSYEQKDVDKLLEEQYEHDCYSDAHEHTTTELSLVPDNSGGFTQWYLSVKTDSNLYDNYC